MKWVPLREARSERELGGKAASLGDALRAGFEVPGGAALDVELVSAMAASGTTLGLGEAILAAAGGKAVAVRSSAVGEDASEASFAGQHLTRLNVEGDAALAEAVRAVWLSGRTEAALAYRRKLGLPAEPLVAVVVQRLVVPEAAGVLFTRNPVTGADERVIEACWGLGEAVVSGLVTPDSWRLARGGSVLEFVAGEKDVEIVPSAAGTEEREVDPARRTEPCLGPEPLAALEKLAEACERHFQGPGDIEWAWAGGRLYLLQRRAITR